MKISSQHDSFHIASAETVNSAGLLKHLSRKTLRALHNERYGHVHHKMQPEKFMYIHTSCCHYSLGTAFVCCALLKNGQSFLQTWLLCRFHSAQVLNRRQERSLWSRSARLDDNLPHQPGRHMFKQYPGHHGAEVLKEALEECTMSVEHVSIIKWN